MRGLRQSADLCLPGCEKQYSVIIGEKTLSEAAVYCSNSAVCIISNRRVWRLYGRNLKKQFPDKTVHHFLVNEGEKEKNLIMVQKIYEYLFRHSFGRKDIICALGGGIVGDIAGFAAATYNRGIRLIMCPTTLLSQVDSSVGGKTGVNFNSVKNLVGAFYQPESVFIDINTLETLSDREFMNGFAEVVKYALLAGGTVFERICALDDLRNIRQIFPVIVSCIEYKGQIITLDERESGLRMILNLGHTCGHGFELVTGLKHGEAVAEGMKIALILSKQLGVMKEQQFRKAITCVCRFFPKNRAAYNRQEFYHAVSKDKKKDGKFLNFVMLEQIGKPVVKKVLVSDIKKAVKEYENSSY